MDGQPYRTSNILLVSLSLFVFFSLFHSFENDEDAKSAVESTESFVLDGRVLNVQFAKSPKKGK